MTTKRKTIEADTQPVERTSFSNRVTVEFEDKGQDVLYMTLEQTTSGRGKVVEAGPFQNEVYAGMQVDLHSVEVGRKLIMFYQGAPNEFRYEITKVLEV